SEVNETSQINSTNEKLEKEFFDYELTRDIIEKSDKVDHYQNDVDFTELRIEESEKKITKYENEVDDLEKEKEDLEKELKSIKKDGAYQTIFDKYQ
ncbi:MAG: hypothetical protein HQM14_22025, partial [SAR324 cluster bacterium]|nr:hypothetical protein [SAR324 cluster bacterium]